jgi:hypothetical protein
MNKINENLGNIYQKGTPFSNGHRSRSNKDGFLLDRHLMIDIDEVILRPNGDIWAIIENKKQQPGPKSKLKNILTTTTNQKLALLELVNRLNCSLFVNIENEKNYYYLTDLTNYKVFKSDVFNKTVSSRGYNVVKTDNQLFIEFRRVGNTISFTCVVSRNSNSIIFNLASKISKLINVVHIDVDDLGSTIDFSIGMNMVGQLKSILNPEYCTPPERIRMEDEWEKLYKKMNVF